jgi:hypothetical protein
MIRRLLLLAPAGMLLGHLAGYTILADHPAAATVDHSHLPAVALVAVAAALTGLVRAAVAGPERPSGRVWRLATAQAGLFLAMEATERLASGAGLELVQAPVVIGLGVQLLAAAMLLLAERCSHLAGEALQGRSRVPPRTRDAPRRVVASAPDAPHTDPSPRPLTRRGPPHLLTV